MLPKTFDLIAKGLCDKLHVGAQLFVTKDNRTIADVVWGDARPGVAMSTDTLQIWMSSSKPIAAVAMAQLWEQGKLALDDPVAKHIPEFGQKGKERVTVRHVLTHTGGFRGVANSWQPKPVEQFLDDIYNAKLEPGWEPGKKAGYHAGSGWFILGEVVSRAAGQPFDRYVREKIFEPIGATDCWIGMPDDVYDNYGGRIALMHTTDTSEPIPHPLWSQKANATMTRAGANGYGPANQLGRFYQMLLNGGELDGVRLLRPQTVEALTSRHRVGMYDQTFKHTIDWALGFIPNNSYHGWETVPYGYGRWAGMRAFGHGGHQTSVGMADPDNGLVIALIFNGAPGDAKHNARIRATMNAIYEDLNLVDVDADAAIG